MKIIKCLNIILIIKRIEIINICENMELNSIRLIKKIIRVGVFFGVNFRKKRLNFNLKLIIKNKKLK